MREFGVICGIQTPNALADCLRALNRLGSLLSFEDDPHLRGKQKMSPDTNDNRSGHFGSPLALKDDDNAFHNKANLAKMWYLTSRQVRPPLEGISTRSDPTQTFHSQNRCMPLSFIFSKNSSCCTVSLKALNKFFSMQC